MEKDSFRFISQRFKYGMNKLFILFAISLFQLTAEEWKSFRGPTGMGLTKQSIPLKWDSSSILWKVELPGTGQSSVVEAEKKIFLTTSNEAGTSRCLLCFDSVKRKLLWKKEIISKAQENTHRMNGWGTPTPATYKNRVVTFFGPAGLHCFDLNGKEIWKLSLGNFPGNWGTASSPIIKDGIVYQNCDSMGPSRLIAVSLETGKIIWDSPRIEKPRGGWSTPIFIESEGRSQIVLNGEYGVRGYKPTSGKEIWFCKGFNGRGSPVPFYGNGLLYVVNGKPGDIYAVEPTGKGDITKTHMKWHSRRNGGRDLPAPAMIGNVVLVTSMSGIITCYDSLTGTTLWIDRLKGSFSGAPLVSKKHYYIQNESGNTYVIKPNKEKMEVLSENSLSPKSEEVFRATLSPIKGMIYTRSQSTLYCVSAL